jgi:hypothetical protein
MSSSNNQSNQKITFRVKGNMTGDTIIIEGVSGTGVDKRTVVQSDKNELKEVILEMKSLLDKLQELQPLATENDMITYLNNETSHNFRTRAISALNKFGETALDEFLLNNKYLKVCKETFKGWLNPTP